MKAKYYVTAEMLARLGSCGAHEVLFKGKRKRIPITPASLKAAALVFGRGDDHDDFDLWWAGCRIAWVLGRLAYSMPRGTSSPVWDAKDRVQSCIERGDYIGACEAFNKGIDIFKKAGGHVP